MSAVEVLNRELYPVEVCDERIAQAEEVLANPDRYERRDFFDARRSHVKWTRRKQAAVAWQLVKEAAEGLLEFSRSMPGFWQHELTSPARQTFMAAHHLEDDAPFTQCDRCGRKSWSLQDGRCGMVQPDGHRCEGMMVA